MQPGERIEEIVPVAGARIDLAGFEDARFIIGFDRLREADFPAVFIEDGIFGENAIVVRIIRPVVTPWKGKVGEERVSLREIRVPVFQSFTLAR